jgi:hypothetical protein
MSYSETCLTRKKPMILIDSITVTVEKNLLCTMSEKDLSLAGFKPIMQWFLLTMLPVWQVNNCLNNQYTTMISARFTSKLKFPAGPESRSRGIVQPCCRGDETELLRSGRAAMTSNFMAKERRGRMHMVLVPRGTASQ